MGKASSVKKVARAARAGSGRRSGQRRDLGFPIAVAIVIVLGVGMVLLARNERTAEALPPQPGIDHWHAAYAVHVCENEIPPLIDVAGDPLGIHTHEDGVVHIHPFLRSSAGRRATLSKFFDDVGLELSDKSITIPGDKTYTEGKDKCGDKDGIVQVAYWESATAAASGEKPSQIITEDFGDIRFRKDAEAYTIAFLPAGADIPAPSTAANLEALGAVDSGAAPTSSVPADSTSVPDSTPESTPESTPDSTTDSVPPDTSAETTSTSTQS